MNHTEGDYRLEKHHDAYRVYSNQDQCIAIFPILKNGKWDVELARESEANAKLFLAAPKIKAVLIGIVSMNSVGYGDKLSQFVNDLQPLISNALKVIKII